MDNLTILIPAFNEEVNIKNLLIDLLSQKSNKYRIQNIIVASDGSTDQTVELANEVTSKKIKVIASKKRLGKNSRINNAFLKNKGNIIVVIDADVKILDKNFLDKLVRPIAKYDLTSSRIEIVKPRTIFEKILSISIDLINSVFSKYKNGNNVYTCRGVARAFSPKLVKAIRFPNSVGDDAYSYFFCKENNFNYKFVNNAVAFIRLPNNYEDHLKQSVRFKNSQRIMQKLFPDINIVQEYKIPTIQFYAELFKLFIKKPILTLSYLYINYKAKHNSKTNNNSSAKWEIAQSSKDLN